MHDRRARLLQTIEEAFQGIELGDGVSLRETLVLDDYGSAEDRQAARALDERHDWRRVIADPELVRLAFIGGLSFYDATGLRFHLPAYLSLAVIDFDRPDAGNVFESLMFQLTVMNGYQLQRFAILDAAQRGCVREVLIFLREEYELEDRELDAAIDGYWSTGL